MPSGGVLLDGIALCDEGTDGAAPRAHGDNPESSYTAPLPTDDRPDLRTAAPWNLS